MAQEKIIIRFDAKGHKPLILAIDKLRLAMDKLEKRTVGVAQSGNQLAKTQHLVNQRMSGNVKTANMLQGAFATLRNKLLLLSFAMTMAIKPILKLIQAQSEAEEIANKFNVVFGRQSEIVREWAGTFGQSVGRASSELQGMLATLQDTFVPLGFARKEATKLSISLTKLALDVGSFNNKLDADVIRDFQSALVGNHETVRKYGIVITEAQLAAEALRSGIIETERELNSQEKVQARLNLIIAGSKDAIGDLERTQDSYANTLKRFNAEVRVTQEELGKKLMPIAAEFLKNMTNLVIHFRDTDAIRNYTMFLVGVGVSMSGLTAATFSLAGAMTFLRSAIIRTGIGGLAVGLGYLADRYIFTGKAADDFNYEIDANAIKAKEASDKIADLAQELDSYELELKSATDSTLDHKDALSGWIGVMRSVHSFLNTSAQLEQRLAVAGFELAANKMNQIEVDKDFIAVQKLGTIHSKERRIAEQNLTIVVKQLEEAEGNARIVLLAKKAELDKQILTYEILHKTEIDNLIIKQKLAKAAEFVVEGEKLTADALRDEIEAFSALEKAEGAAMDAAEERAELDLFKFDVQRTEALIAEKAAMMEVVRGEEELDAIRKIGISAYAQTEAGQKKLIKSMIDIIGANENMLSGLIDVDATLLKLNETYLNIGKEELTLREQIIGKMDEQQLKEQELASIRAEKAAIAMSQMKGVTSAWSSNLNARLKAELDTLKESEEYQKANSSARKKMEKDKTDSFANEQKALFYVNKAMSLSDIYFNTASAVMKSIAISPQSAGQPWAGIAMVLGGIQAGIVATQKPPSFQQGGIIGGSRHSQGGTIIEAEQGEYIMNRNAVQSIGLENLNSMNQTGGGGAITVNVSGNVLTQDFVDTDLAEAIKTSIRRNGREQFGLG